MLRRLAIGLVLSLLFLVGELGLRAYARFSDYIPKVDLYDAPHHYLGRALVPNASYRGGKASLHVNSRGFRGEEFAVPKPAGTYRIFALGGSTTFGYYPATTSDETAYPAVLQGELNRHKPNPAVGRYEVVNAGVPGYSLRTSMQNFSARVLFLQPDMVVIYHLTNDLARYGNEANLTHPLMNQFVAGGVVSGLVDQVMGWSYLFQELRFSLWDRLAGALLSRLGGTTGSAGQAGAWQVDERYLEAFRRDLRNLVVLAKANGVTPVVASQAIAFTAKTDFAQLTTEEKQMLFDRPAIFYAKVPPGERFGLFERYNRIIRDVATSEGAIFADVNGAIPKTPEYFWDYCHLTDKGSALQAQVILRAIQQAKTAAPR